MALLATQKRTRSAALFRPANVDCLFVAEAPPSDETRYFYFENVPTRDSLYLELSKALFFCMDVGRMRSEKVQFLEHLRGQGIWLIDLSEEPVPVGVDKHAHLRQWVGSLVDRCSAIRPRRVILLATSVFDVAYQPLIEAGVPVVGERIPFPGSGRQKEFRAAFWNAMNRAHMNAGPVVLDGNCISYWLGALDHVAAPDKDDPLGTQKLSLVRMFYYWPWVLSYTPGIRAEVERIKNAERRANHEQWMDVHLRELPGVDPKIGALFRERLAGRGVNEKDAVWMAEVLATGSPPVITWDQTLLHETVNVPGIEVVSPEAAWASLSIPAGTPSRITPSPDNPLSQQDWWKV